MIKTTSAVEAGVTGGDMNIADQKSLIMDWIYEEGNEAFSAYDYEFWCYWMNRSGLGKNSGRILQRRINELVREGRLDRYRLYNEPTRPAGVPFWLYVYGP